MNHITGAIRSYPKTFLITLSLIVAATAFWFTSARNPGESTSKDTSKETTYSYEPTEPRFGAAVYFPQGTNPSLLEELAPEVAEDGTVNIEGARWKRGEIIAFGTASGKDIRCELLADGVVLSPEESKPDLQTAGNVFLQTFRPDYREGTDYSIECRIGGVSDRRIISGAPSDVSP